MLRTLLGYSAAFLLKFYFVAIRPSRIWIAVFPRVTRPSQTDIVFLCLLWFCFHSSSTRARLSRSLGWRQMSEWGMSTTFLFSRAVQSSPSVKPWETVSAPSSACYTWWSFPSLEIWVLSCPPVRGPSRSTELVGVSHRKWTEANGQVAML